MTEGNKITPQEALLRTIEHREIFHDEMLYIVRQIMQGEWSPVMLAAFITGFEVMVSFLQAFVFALLTAVYIAGALHPHH